jgi:hypothetical protein
MNRTQRLTASIVAAVGLLAILALPAAAAAKDRNHDRIPDRWEKRHRLSLKVNQANRDQDRDQLRNRAEFMAGDNPRNADTDGDGIPDGEENAGTIKTFDTGTGELVIDLFGGETISGMVTEETEIECERSISSASASDSNQGEDNSGDEQGQEGQENQEEPGDDDGGDDSGPGSPNSGPGQGDDNDNEANCTTADLVPGAVVQEAELKVDNGTATFEEVELAG